MSTDLATASAAPAWERRRAAATRATPMERLPGVLSRTLASRWAPQAWSWSTCLGRSTAVMVHSSRAGAETLLRKGMACNSPSQRARRATCTCMPQQAGAGRARSGEALERRFRWAPLTGTVGSSRSLRCRHWCPASGALTSMGAVFVDVGMAHRTALPVT